MILWMQEYPRALQAPEHHVEQWLLRVAEEYNCTIEELLYIGMTDKELHAINLEFLRHDTYTDIITFDESQDRRIRANICISVERITENASRYNVPILREELRVISHGLLHCIGLKDKTPDQSRIMRDAENHCIDLYFEMFHVEQNN